MKKQFDEISVSNASELLGVSPRTIINYVKSKLDYKNYVTETGGLNGHEMAPKTVGKNLAAISSYFDYLVLKNFIDSNPVKSVKRPRLEVIR